MLRILLLFGSRRHIGRTFFTQYVNAFDCSFIRFSPSIPFVYFIVRVKNRRHDDGRNFARWRAARGGRRFGGGRIHR